jgi:hypothetical protein
MVWAESATALRKLAFACGLALALPAAAVTLRPDPDLSMEVGAQGITGLTALDRPRPLSGAGGWSFMDLAEGHDHTIACPLPLADAPSMSAADLLAPPAKPDDPEPAPCWQPSNGWKPAGRTVAPQPLGAIWHCDVPAGGFGAPLRLIAPVSAAARAGAAVTVTVFVRASDFHGQVRLGVLPVNAIGVTTDGWLPFDPPRDDMDAERWTARTCRLLLPPATAGLVVYLAAEDAAGALECGGATLTIAEPGPPHAFSGTLSSPAADHAVFHGSGGNLSLEADYRVEPGAIRLGATVSTDGKAERALSLTFSLPIDATGWEWWSSTRRVEMITPGQRTYALWRHVAGGHLYSPYPLGVITSTGPAAGLGLAVSMSQRVPARFAYHQDDGLYVSFDLGLAPAAGKGSAHVELTLFPVESRWGMRDALARYYRLYPADVGNGYPRPGAWFTAADPAVLARPETFGLMFDEQAHSHPEWSRTHRLAGLTTLAPWGVWRAAGPPKLIPAGGWYPNEPTTPTDPPAAQQLLDAAGAPLRWRVDDGVDFIPLATAPGLGPAGAAAQAQALLADRLRNGDAPLDGVAVDGVAAGFYGWEAEDYAPEHWRAGLGPLTCNHITRRPVLLAAAADCELLDAVARTCAPPDKLVLGGPDGSLPLPWVMPPLSVVAAGERTPPLEFLRWLRCLAPHKPLTFLEPELLTPASPANLRQTVWQQALLLGAFPGAAGWFDADDVAHVEPQFAQYVPLLRRLCAAQWEPVPYATVNDADLELERFGAGEQLCLVVANPTAKARSVTLTLEPLPLGLITRDSGGLERRRLEFGDLLAPARDHARCSVAFDRWQTGLSLAPYEEQVLAPVALEPVPLPPPLP